MASAPSNENAMTLTESQLDAYLARIGVDRSVSRDIDGLAQLQRAHLMNFTWETLDAFMGWPSSMAPDAIFAKMVEGRRGGWCFEMNGLFGAALDALGFRVMRLCGCVDRPKLGDVAIGNHLTLQVDLDRPYLVEVGAGDTMIAPVPLAAGPISQRGFAFSIEPTDDGWFRLHNHPHGIARTIDFRSDHRDEAAMAAMKDWLTKDPGSPFTNALAVFRHTADGYVSLQNDLLRRVTASTLQEQHVTSADQFADTLEHVFDLDIAHPERVWEKVVAASRDRAA